MQTLMPLAESIASRLTLRGESVVVAESAAGGLISASLLAIPGASAYFLGGAVIYTYKAREALLGLGQDDMAGLRPSTEAYAALLAGRMRKRHDAVWGLAETGAAGPTGNRYGDAAGHVCAAVAGPLARVATLETGSDDRQANMRAFAACALEILADALNGAR